MLDGKTARMLKFLIYVAFIGVLSAGVLIAAQYVLPIIYPFVIAWLISLVLHPAVTYLEKHIKMPKKLSISILVLLTVAFFSTICYIIISQVVGELETLVQNITDKISELQNNPELVEEWIKKIDSIVPFVDVTDTLRNFWQNLDQKVIDILATGASNISGAILPFFMNLLSGFADFFLNFVIIVVACFYMTLDYKKIGKFISFQFPEKVRKIFKIIKNEFFKTTAKYLKAYGIILFITFSELLVAFLIINIKYAFLLALLISLVDILPVVGTGTILIPWSLITIFVSKDYYTGIALLVTYLIITIIREIIEPKIVGNYIGLYPLVTLIAMYVGLKTFGIIGLFLFPILIIIVKNLNDNGHFKIWRTPEDDFEPPKTPFRLITFFRKFTKKGRANLEKEKTDAVQKADSEKDADAEKKDEENSDDKAQDNGKDFGEPK